MKFARLLLFICCCLLLGWALGDYLSRDQTSVEAAVEAAVERAPSNEKPPVQSSDEVVVDGFTGGGQLVWPSSAIRNQYTLSFALEADYLAYLRRLDELGLDPLGAIDALRVVRVGVDVISKLDPGLYNAVPDFAYRVVQPPLPVEINPEALSRLRSYGVSAQQIVGGLLDGDGSGVLVAVLDSGITDHSQFSQINIDYLDLLDGEKSGAAHGTSVASIITGKEGVAPAADLVAVRVLDDTGVGNDFDVAQGIVLAVDLGARIVNMSLGSYQDSAVLRDAVSYASERGVVIVASAGNDGVAQLPYPAAYEGVLSVTAVDANGRQAVFPNQSTAIDIAAPGVGIQTANEELGSISFSGTSAAAPFVSGTLAAILSAHPGMTGAEAAALLKESLNDAGAMGPDPVYGDGVLDWHRLSMRDTDEVYDIALADIYLPPGSKPGTSVSVGVTVQNRGTAYFPKSELRVRVGDQESLQFYIGTLKPGEVVNRSIFVQAPSTHSEEGVEILASVAPEEGRQEFRLDNNVRSVLFTPVD